VGGDLFHGEQRRDRWRVFLTTVLPLFKLLEEGLGHFRADERRQLLLEEPADDLPERIIERGAIRRRRGAHG
jgi:hypothetical protein